MRRHTHAGSWYDDDADSLQQEIEEALSTDEEASLPSPKYIISPHAGYTYSLKTAATVYRKIDVLKIVTIFILGPSHYVSFRGCGIDTFSSLQTPVGVLQVDTDITKKLLNEDGFLEISRAAAEREHSIEMQLPILRHLMNRAGAGQVKVVPIIVGSMDAKRLEMAGKALLPYFQNKDTAFVISSDFCHFGRRFDFTVTGYENEPIPLCEGIKKLDMDGVDHILKHDLDGFREYLMETGNTICGCNAIQVLLMLIKLSEMSIRSEMIAYTQGIQDSSVSYCSIAGVES
ncbi:cell motility mediator, putative [Babesia ovata]|uniref:Cell motility mediator, putative n=1 Tax=Babesia ovata TaxID=189622 RepID=A0A2H6KER0_9APIC|nr:cell motility mediator, putative [Babesia ovata]GBE61483.1 cell motility mediator, putative [Babesia ovata]